MIKINDPEVGILRGFADSEVSVGKELLAIAAREGSAAQGYFFEQESISLLDELRARPIAESLLAKIIDLRRDLRKEFSGVDCEQNGERLRKVVKGYGIQFTPRVRPL